MKLIEEWRQSWRLWSVRLSALGAILTGLALAAPDFLQSLWNGLPTDLRALLPVSVTHAVPTALFILTIVARIVSQNAPKSPASDAAQQSVTDAADHLTPLLARVTAVETMIRDVLSGVAEVRAAQQPAVALVAAVAASPSAEGGDAAPLA
ncbi:hypothetical protein [uncultured Sphingomonas sp.]|uniref:DUF7940 domain-containing protein n=1 Tax=uncultured Sphingomonas sp. TaxID=158754 RepID=UPI0025952309|nr:hypothetical protein [uncultured Sphingomonas sp.]